MISRKAGFLLVGLLLVLGCVARIAHLDADPYFASWIQYVVDEGRWNESARNLALFGSPEGSNIGRLHLILSPGYQAVNYVAFRLFGVEFWSARMFAAASGIAILLGVFFSLRRHVTAPALALGVVILGFETNLLAESRLALPEVPSLLGMLLAFLLLVIGRKSRWNAFLAGVLAAVAVGLKGTSLLIVPVFPLMIAFSRATEPPRERLKRTLAFAAGFVLPIAAGSSLALTFGLLDVKGLGSAGARFVDFLSVADPRYALWRFFESTQLEIRNLMLLGIWFCSWIWFHRESRTSAVTREVYLMSGLWAGWWFVLWSINDYSPGRYVVHFVVPATIHIVAGLSLGGRDTIARIAAALVRSRGLARAARLAWLVLPSAILVSTMLAGLGEHVGLDVSRVAARIALIVALDVLMAVAALRSGPREGVIAAFLIFPILLTLLWLGGRELGIFSSFWKHDNGAALALWAALAAVLAAACYVMARTLRASQWTTAVLVVVIVQIAVIFLAQAVPAVVAPTFSIRDASRQIGQLYSTTPEIRTVSASSLFLANTLNYRELSRRDPRRYDILVVFEHNLSSRQFLQSERAYGLVRVQTYPLTVHPRYELEEAKFGPASIAVFRQMQHTVTEAGDGERIPSTNLRIQ